MAVNEHLNGALQENLLTLAAFNNDHGKIVVNLADPALFEGDYRLLFERVLDYWKRHAKAPESHTADLVADIIEDKKNRKATTFKSILSSMIDLSESINTDYVTDQLKTFTRMQRIKAAILKSAEKLNTNKANGIADVEQIWNDILRVREIDFDPGKKLTDVDHVLESMRIRQAEFVSGIELLDKYHISPARKATMLFLAPTGWGKSWWLIHIGKHALMQRKKVLHISLEMGEEEVLQRYYQSLFAVGKRKAEKGSEPYITEFLTDRFGRVEGFERDQVEANFTLDSPKAAKELKKRLKWYKVKMNNLYVKQFPTRSLTLNQLRGFLDNLEIVNHFIPDMIILDYIGIMNTNQDNFRISLGRVYEEWRGLLIQRNAAGVTVHQTSKISAQVTETKSTHVAEDWSLIHTSDTVVAYSRTPEEKKLGLARLSVLKARGEQDNFTIAITQNYDLGQFCLDSKIHTPKYSRLMEEYYDGIIAESFGDEDQMTDGEEED